MNLSRWLAVLLLVAPPLAARAADWKPAPAKLMTRWGKQVTPENAWTEYPRPQLVRKDWLNLNGLWDYAVAPKTVDRPEAFDGKILVPFCIESALSGVGKPVTPDQHLWYSRSFEVPAAWAGKRVLLHFGAVDWETVVSVNGKRVGVHLGGSDPFSFDVTEALRPGKNELLVRVWDPTDQGAQPRGKQKLQPESIWYTPVTGIWQTVWLEPVADVSVAGVRIEPDLDRGGVHITVTSRGDVAGSGWGFVLKSTDQAIASKKPSSTFGTAEFVAFRDAQPWTPDNPKLYDVEISLTKDGKTVDTVSSYFAMRKIGIGPDDKGLMRLLLNNKPLFQLGPLDQGWWPDGLLTPPSDAAMRYDLEVLKSLGMNMLRKHIKVEPARYYRACDELGLLVWQDMPSGMAAGRRHQVQPGERDDVSFTPAEDAQFRAELKAMIDHLRVFPSIVVWVPFNEGWGQHATNEILQWVKSYDPTRLVNGPSGWTDRDFGDMKDMHNYPGPGMFPAMPDRVSVLGEFGGLGLPLKGHLWKDSDNWGYQSFRTTEDLRQGYRQLVARMRPLVGRGLSAAVYTQTTDVEVEVNGLMTYDREVVKMDVKQTAAWHKALFGPPPEVRELVPTSVQAARKWRHTTAKPPTGWERPDFDAGAWPEADGGFGTRGTPGAVVRTEWNTADIWIRRSFELSAAPAGEVSLEIHHDEDAEVYINGVLAATVAGYTSNYETVPIRDEARKALRTGANTIAIHCHQTGGGQYIDAGLIELVPAK